MAEVSTHWHCCYRTHLDCANIEIERWRKVAANLAEAIRNHGPWMDDECRKVLASYDAQIDGKVSG